MLRTTPESSWQESRFLWFVLVSSMLCLLGAAEVENFQRLSPAENLAAWLIGTAIGIVLYSVWYYLGSRMFRCHPTFSNCLLAAIIPQIAMVVLAFLAGIVIGILACLNVVLGLIVAIIAVIYLVIIYVRWVNAILEIESMGVAWFLVLTPGIIDLLIKLALASEV
jgi:hypothetical protein